MTTTLMIAASGNKQVQIETESGRWILQPGRWIHGITIHSDKKIVISEIEDFINEPVGSVPAVQYVSTITAESSTKCLE